MHGAGGHERVDLSRAGIESVVECSHRFVGMVDPGNEFRSTSRQLADSSAALLVLVRHRSEALRYGVKIGYRLRRIDGRRHRRWTAAQVFDDDTKLARERKLACCRDMLRRPLTVGDRDCHDLGSQLPEHHCDVSLLACSRARDHHH